MENRIEDEQNNEHKTETEEVKKPTEEEQNVEHKTETEAIEKLTEEEQKDDHKTETEAFEKLIEEEQNNEHEAETDELEKLIEERQKDEHKTEALEKPTEEEKKDEHKTETEAFEKPIEEEQTDEHENTQATEPLVGEPAVVNEGWGSLFSSFFGPAAASSVSQVKDSEISKPQGVEGKECQKQEAAMISGPTRTWKPFEYVTRTIPRATTDFRQRDRARCAHETLDDVAKSVKSTSKREALLALLEKSSGGKQINRARGGQRVDV